ncbi:nectin-3-like protein isoform X2 [Triplophysa rosa]|uniref:nectin-3-like protein isoform X2 n=1 Tax=Triplophysa rosa TaxID=992332 RepID=UPI0025462BC8|nr:nectin-3-like protein isoform X2 [Triplophysa rosa]
MFFRHILTITCISYFISSSEVTTDAVLVVGRSDVNLATCTASTSQSPAEVSWNLGTLSDSVKEVKNTVENQDEMYTVSSSLIGVPTVAMNQLNVQCVARHHSLKEELAIDHKMVVHYSPQLVYITPLLSGDGFQCEADANPKAMLFRWKRMNQTIHNNAIKTEGNRLYFLKPTSDLNGLYICEASNEYGIGTGSLYWQKGGFHSEL